MTRERSISFDTTLRDGQQTQGVVFSTPEKVRSPKRWMHWGSTISKAAGPVPTRPTASFLNSAQDPRDDDRLWHDQTQRRSAENDDVLAGVMNAGTPAVCLVGKTHDFHVTTALGITLDENVENIRDSFAHIVAQGREAIFDAEHFFDGYKANPDYALRCIHAALMRARAVSRCATPMAARCPTRSGASSAR